MELITVFNIVISSVLLLFGSGGEFTYLQAKSRQKRNK
jgi:hypothetical protein